MLDKFKKYWQTIVMVIMGIAGACTYVYNKGAESNSLEGRTFDNPEQKVFVVGKVESLPTEREIGAQITRDSMNTVHAMQTRQKRYEDGVRSDSIKRRSDSLILDVVTRQAVQLEQVKEQLKTITNE